MTNNVNTESPLRCYVAAPWDCKPEAKAARTKLEEAGFIVISHWIDLLDDVAVTEKYEQEQAEVDVEDLFNADALVLLNLHKSEGKACETGMSIAAGMPVICIGPRQNNIFLHLPEILQVDTIEEAINLLQSYQTLQEEIFREAAQTQGFLDDAFIAEFSGGKIGNA